MKNFVVCLVLLASLFTTYSCSKKSLPPVNYPFTIIEDDLDAAKQSAQTNNKNIFLMVHADWCSNCQTFKTTVLQSQTVKTKLSAGIVTSLIDGDKTYGKPIANTYNVNSFPTFIILDNKGVELARKKGLMNEADFLNWINSYLK
jgi:thioredoxin-related protein